MGYAEFAARITALPGGQIRHGDAIRSRGRFLGWVLLCAAATGCGGWQDPDRSPPYLPAWPEARAAVETALSGWRDGTPNHSPSGAPGSVMFLDKQRLPAQKLGSFAILSQSEVDNVRQFTVRLQIEGETSPRLVRYNVLGRNPAWVFRLEDFESICHWEHPMDEAGSGPASQTEEASSASDRKD
jgi:hypothetical protein